MASEITTGERPRVTILVGASAAPSHAPAVKPLAMPASWRARRGGPSARQQDALALRLGVGHRHGGEQRRGVGMAGAAVKGGCGRALHDFAQVHDRHLIRDVLHDREIVSDEQVGEPAALLQVGEQVQHLRDRKSTRLNSSHSQISYAVFCLKKKKKNKMKTHDSIIYVEESGEIS